jgi:hypothetical protein
MHLRILQRSVRAGAALCGRPPWRADLRIRRPDLPIRHGAVQGREDGEVGYKKVLSVSKRIAPVILAITLLSGAVVEATPEHPLERAGEISNLKSQISTKSQISNLNDDGCGADAPTAYGLQSTVHSPQPTASPRGPLVIWTQDGRRIPADAVVSVQEKRGSFAVYNMIVEEWHAYGVAGGVVAHNGACPPIAARGLWEITKEGTDKVLKWGETKVYRQKSTKLWWSKDTAGHGGSVWKVFQEEGGGLRHVADADKYGDFIRGKHKGPIGKFIPGNQLSGG